jgi:imidazolonepropionase-like amidohydrolase
MDRIANGEVSVPPDQHRKAMLLAPERANRLREAADQGVSFVLGTDADGFLTPFDEAMSEVRRMSRILGVPAEKALSGATSGAAHALRRDETMGRVAAGYAADFVVIKGRPWENIDDLVISNIVCVVSRGRVAVGALPDGVFAAEAA